MKIVVIVSIVAVLVIVAISSNKSQNSITSSPAPAPHESVLTSGAKYIIYSADEYEEGKESRRVLYFYANWCPTCRPVDAEFKQNESQIPSDVRVYRVNYNDPDTDDEEKKLAAKYGITYQHTFVQVDRQGNELTKWNGGGLSEMIANIK